MTAKHAFGTTFAWNSNVVAKLNNIGGVEITSETVDTTTHQSLDRFKEFIMGLNEAGEIAIEGFLEVADSTGQMAMLSDANSGTMRTAIVTFPDSIAIWTFTAGITKIKIGDSPIDGAIPFSASVKISGKPSLALATSTGLTTPFFAISESAVITPTLSGSVFTYVATVLTGVTSVTVTPTATAGVITVNGNTVATGVESSAIALGAAGSVTTITIVVTETNKVPKTYTIYLSRAAS